MRAANTAKQQADQAAKRYEEAFGKHVEENPDSAVASPRQDGRDAEGQVRNAERLEAERPNEDAVAASGRASELDRRAKVLEELPRAKESWPSSSRCSRSTASKTSRSGPAPPRSPSRSPRRASTTGS